ncbi:hypothetical protein Y886_43845, partial [Xanthomonas hyacinthi DSM 19077]
IVFRAEVVPGWGLEAWRAAARAAWCAQVAPASLLWEGDAQGGLLIGTEVAALPATVAAPRVSAEFLALAGAVPGHGGSRGGALAVRVGGRGPPRGR